jgi:mediator of RNA polymerase II transcription subunit 14
MNQNRQFDDAIHGLTLARDSLDGARYDAGLLSVNHTHISVRTDSRLRNHDLLTSLDVLTTGSYRRLPTMIKVQTSTRVARCVLKISIEIHHTSPSPH